MSAEHPVDPADATGAGGPGADQERASTASALPKASLRDRMRPWELLGLSAVVAVFVGLVVLLATRNVQIAIIFGGIAFIVALVLFAMLSLASPPSGEERHDLDEQDRGH